mgnify:CR=1 FL=1
MRTRIKICGITCIEDALAAAQAGADAIGLVFDPKSPRCVDVRQAVSIAHALPPYITVVGLFVDATPQSIHDVLNRVNLDLLQFHGAETPEYCRAFPKPYVKAIRMSPDVDLHAEERRFPEAAGLLLDTFSPVASGGTGEVFDWGRVPRDLKKSVILAGGLTPGNVADAIRRVRPYAVDVSSGVESTKGIKDTKKIAAFVEAAKSVTA